MSQKWDLRFLELAKHVSGWSKDPSTKCGSVIVRPDSTIASVGFNGFPAVIEDTKELLNNREEKYKRIVHAELNAIAHANGSVGGFTMYNFPVAPCDSCAKHALTFGIRRFVYPIVTQDMLSRWKDSLASTERLLFEASRNGVVSFDEYRGNAMDHNQLSTELAQCFDDTVWSYATGLAVTGRNRLYRMKCTLLAEHTGQHEYEHFDGLAPVGVVTGPYKIEDITWTKRNKK